MVKKGVIILFVIGVILTTGFVFSAAIDEELHLNIQVINSSGDVNTGTFNFTFNISTTYDCANVVYTNSTNLTTDSRGIISYYLEKVNLSFSSQYWLCYYRDDVLINASKIARTPYSFTAKNVSADGIINDSNMDLTGKTGFFGWLGSLTKRITTLFVQDIDFSGMINGSGNINTTGNVTANYFFGDGADFNNGWLNGGVSISGGDLYAQTVWVYNLSSLNVNSLSVNGSILPPVGFDNTFDIGNSSLRWKDIYISGNLHSNGTGDNYFLGKVGIGTGSPSNMLDVRGQGNFSGTIFINNATDISTWALNVSRNWTAMTFTGFNSTWDNNWVNEFAYNHTSSVFTTWNSTWDNRWINTLANLQGVMNASGIYETFNTTYDDYALNVSRNWTDMAFDAWGENWYNHTLSTFNTYNSTWDESGWVLAEINTTANIQGLLNDTGIYETYNTTYDDYALNVSRNWTAMTFAGYNTIWNNYSWNRSGTDVILGYTGDKVGIGTDNPGSKLTVWEGDFNVSNAARGQMFYVQNSSGNVGIGTDSPTAGLEIYRSAGADTVGGGIILSRYEATGVNYRGGAIYNEYVTGPNTDFLFFGVTTDNGKNPYSDIDQVRMVIGANGNVGIGTTSPTHELNVVGNVNITGNITMGDAFMFTDGSGNMIFRI